MSGPAFAVVGLDLSLTSTGLADRHGVPRLMRSTSRRGMARLAWIRDGVAPFIRGVDLVVIEGYAYGRANGREALGELGGVIRLWLHEHDVPYLDVPPSTLKMYATGRGNAGKTEVVIAARDRLGYQGTDDNEADALWLRALGLELFGLPPVVLPKSHRRALDKLTPPDQAAA